VNTLSGVFTVTQPESGRKAPTDYSRQFWNWRDQEDIDWRKMA
jgi:hypothetical protein